MTLDLRLKAIVAALALVAAACADGARSELLGVLETASRRVGETDAYVSDIDRDIESLATTGNWDLGEGSTVRQDRERIAIEHDELVSRCVSLKFEAEEGGRAIETLKGHADDALRRAEANYRAARDFRNALRRFRERTERLASNIAVCQTYLNQMRSDLAALAPMKEGAPRELRERITLHEARYEALRRGENEATGLARESLKQSFANPSVADAGSNAALVKLSKLQLEIRDALTEVQALRK